ncbi:hypothetical protein P43SY_007955 [Pythium insidiosum]|uniref:Transmembrane protein n=1 Tax=Pythium insidiosum TaxID=114742 RepID=A0AAD5Q264_PYTIN|nr:hypothetical protein P43SY_007955 [Pythium insidiosum]
MAAAASKRLLRLRDGLGRLWVSAQVELQGRYSLHNFQDLDDYYARTPWWRAALVCLLTPLPAITVVLLIDLLPLDPISYGPHSVTLWVRTYITIVLLTVAILEQFRQHVAQLRLTRRSIWIISLLTPAVSVSSTYGMTLLVGYPLPFAMLAGTIPWLLTLVTLLLVFYHQQLRTNRRLVRDLLCYHVVFGCQVLMTLVYPAFSFLYSRLSSLEQTLTIFFLPVMKIAIKNGIGRWLPDTDDARPEAVVFNIEIFHALFVAFTMQKTTSVITILALMAVDCGHAWLTFLDVTMALRRVGIVTSKLERRTTASLSAPSAEQRFLHKDLRWLLQVAICKMPTAPGNPGTGPPTAALPSNLDMLTAEEKRTLVQTVLKVLYISEFLALIEYTEVVMPMIFIARLKLKGRYSLLNFQDLDDYYARTPWWRAVLVCLLTPMPAVAVGLLIDLLPLDPIAYGAESVALWLRTFITITLISLVLLEQFRQHVSELRLTRRIILVVALLSAGISVSCTFTLARLVCYPLPFSMIVGTVPWLIVLVSALFAFYHEQFRSNRRLVRDLTRYLVVFACQILMTLVYPAFSFLYSRLTSVEQTFAILFLPLMKFTIKNGIGRWLPDTDDSRPEAVVFNIEVFHALFVAFTMQKTTSVVTILALMAVDCGHAWLTFYDVTIVLRRVGDITKRLESQSSRVGSRGGTSPRRKELRWLLHVAMRAAALAPDLTARTVLGDVVMDATSPGSHRPVAFVKVVPIAARLPADARSLPRLPPDDSSATAPSDLAALSTEERRTLVQTVLKVLYISEFLALIEYTEVVMPMIFSTSFMCLAFVLETRQVSIQAKLMLWVLYTIQNSIIQLGADFSFRFEWLHAPGNTSSSA